MMKPLKNLLILLSILLPLSAHAWGVVATSGGVAAAPAATNGEIGNKSGANSSNTTVTATDYAVWGSFTTVTAGQVSYIHIYMQYAEGTQTFNAGIYSSDGTTKLAEGDVTTLAGEPVVLHIQLDSPYTLEAATAYRLAISGDGCSYWQPYCTDGGEEVRYDNAFTTGDTLPDALDNNGQQINYYRLRIWATNTSDGS